MQTRLLHGMMHHSFVRHLKRWPLRRSSVSYERIRLSEHGHITSRAPQRPYSITSLFGARDELLAVATELKYLRQEIAAMNDQHQNFSGMTAKERLRWDKGAVFDTAYEVAWYAMKEEPHELGPAVDKLVSSVIEQGAGAQSVLRTMQQQIRKDVAPTSEVMRPLKVFTSYLMGRRYPDVVDDGEVMDATAFMDGPSLESQGMLKAIQRLKVLLGSRYTFQTNGWWLPYLEALRRYYACKLSKDSSKLKDVVAGNFVMFALPVALDAKDLQCPVDTLEVDIVWPIDFDYLGGGCEIKIGEAKSRATSENVREARKQLARSLLFLEWACKQIYGARVCRITLKGVIAILDTGPDKRRFTKKVAPIVDSYGREKITFSLVKV